MNSQGEEEWTCCHKRKWDTAVPYAESPPLPVLPEPASSESDGGRRWGGSRRSEGGRAIPVSDGLASDDFISNLWHAT